MTEKAPVTATASTATVQSGPAKGSMMSKQARSFDSCDYFQIKAHSVVCLIRDTVKFRLGLVPCNLQGGQSPSEPGLG